MKHYGLDRYGDRVAVDLEDDFPTTTNKCVMCGKEYESEYVMCLCKDCESVVSSVLESVATMLGKTLPAVEDGFEEYLKAR